MVDAQHVAESSSYVLHDCIGTGDELGAGTPGVPHCVVGPHLTKAVPVLEVDAARVASLHLLDRLDVIHETLSVGRHYRNLTPGCHLGVPSASEPRSARC